MKVYIAAPFERIQYANMVAEKLRRSGIEVCSRWLTETPGKRLEDLSQKEIDALIEQNDVDVLLSDHLLAIAVPGLGGEMFAEVSLALTYNFYKDRVVWCGERVTLSAYRPGVVRFGSVPEGVEYLIRKNREHGR